MLISDRNHQRRHGRTLAPFLLIGALMLSACGAAEPAPPATPFQPAVTIFAPPPAATETPQPPATPTATAEAVAAATVSDTAPSSAPASVMIDGTVNPYTGLPISDPAVLARKPVLIKVANTA